MIDVVDEFSLRDMFEFDRFEQVDNEGHIDVPEECVLLDALSEDFVDHLW